jgi:hypothetical protein
VEQIGKICCNRHEELWISLKEVCKKWHIELRLFGRSEAGTPQPRAGGGLINLPIEQVPLVVDRLVQALDSCVKRGLVSAPPAKELIIMDRGEPVVLREHSRMQSQRGRRHPRMSVRYPLVCQTVASTNGPRSQILKGEFRDLGVGGAQVWLPNRLELGQLLEVAAMIDGQPFRARAEIVGAGLQSKHNSGGQSFRHSLRWLSYNAAAGDILTLTLVRQSEGQGLAPGSTSVPEGPLEPATISAPRDERSGR